MITTLFLGFVAADGRDRRCTGRPLPERSNRFRHHSWAVRVTDLRRPTGIFGVVRNAAMRPPGIAFTFLPRPGLSGPKHLGIAMVCWASCRAGFSAVDRSGYAKLPHRRRTVPAPALDRRYRSQNADLRRVERGHLCWSVSAPYRLAVSARGKGLKLALIGNVLEASLTDERRDSRRVDNPGPFNLIHTEVANLMIGVSIYVHSRIFRADDFTRQIGSQSEGERLLHSALSGPNPPVPWTDPGGFNFEKDLATAGIGPRDSLEPHDVRRPKLVHAPGHH
jgi:hypothetical protein